MVRSSQATTFSSSPYFFDRGSHGTAQPISERVAAHSRPIVSYYFPKGVGAHHYGERHPMKPHRLTLTNALVMGYGLDKQIHNIYDVRAATQTELEAYHDHDYIDFLSRVTPQNQSEMRQMIDKFNCGEDCPIFADLYDFCRMYAGGSLAGARKLCAGTTDIAINWSGGLHHAKRGEASGFCYVNDIVLAILELLRYHPRVLYIDIDIHHGDGVELAFYQSNRVMTDGINDTMYLEIFKSVIEDTVTAFRPTSIVLQCGADSLGCDRLGAFNLSIAAHGECVNFVRKFNVPLLVVGGGGYTIKNVSRCWTYETSVLVGASIPNELPATVYDSFFKDSQWKLHPPLTGKVDNQNSRASLQRITVSIRNKLRYLQGAPSVAMQEIPPDIQGFLADEERTVEEREEEISTGAAGERRSDRVTTRNDYFEGDNDVDQDNVLPTPTSRGRATGTRRGRAGRPRGRGRGRGRPPLRDDDDDDDDDDDGSVSPKSRGRGRGKAVAVAAASEAEVEVEAEVDKDKDSTDPDPDALMDLDG
ncbi:hypothetical protein B0H10DRAFT_2160269 [Mycena sp. CBHHK59/15]|nr:hypothetical protein B0H10DRAFT_2160269 [Mycena sp. CBHHK59/15]